MNYLFVNCFGRGGSAILMSMLSASPHVIRGDEWHQVVFGPRRVGKAVRLLRGLNHSTMDTLVGRWSRHVLDRRWSEVADPAARIVALKVMDHYAMFDTAIIDALAPGRARFIAFIRHPIGVCESLMRSGMSLDEAIEWYLAVMARIERAARAHEGYIVYRFEDLLADPENFAQHVYQDLGLQPPMDGAIELKIKRYGEKRLQNENASLGYSRVAIAELSAHLDASVNRRALLRLGQANAEQVAGRTTEMASRWYRDISSVHSIDDAATLPDLA